MKTDTYNTADAARHEDLASRALQAAGVGRTNADLVAEILVDADLRGIKSHGVMNLYQYYVKKVQDGIIKAEPEITLQQCTKTTALIDADNGLGNNDQGNQINDRRVRFAGSI
ncbi:Ldh family oxidoreductase [Marispirochaeta sp.]|uniref:Ldh family oxidoreductase n=1 Tax=Marispirochaeta sp. TaxID=2038653 RepID=UPI0029C8F395|nr:Ldh family oxidoreductase [Marispirochaeta sp.]